MNAPEKAINGYKAEKIPTGVRRLNLILDETEELCRFWWTHINPYTQICIWR